MSVNSTSDATPRLGALQWVGPGLIGLLTLVVALTQEALVTKPAQIGSGSLSPILPAVYDFLILLFYSPILIGLLASLIGAFRAIAAASHRQEFRALMDLGAPRRNLVRRQARLGLVHGALAALGGTVLGAGIAQASAGLGGEFNSTTAWTLLITVCLSIAATTLAYWVVGSWVTGHTGHARQARDAVAAPGVAPVVATAPASRTRRKRRIAVVALAAFGVVSALVTPHLTTSSAVPSGLVTAWTLAYALVVGLGLPVMVVWAGAKGAAWLSGLAGRALMHGGNAARIAGDGLTRTIPARAVAIGAVGLVLGGTLMIGVIFNATGARNDAGSSLTPRLVVSTTGLPNRDLVGNTSPMAVGWNRQGLDPKLVAELQADDRFIVVPAAMLTARVASVDRAVVVNPDTITYVALSPRDLDRVSQGAPRALYFAGAVAMGGGPTPSVLTVGDTSAEVTTPLVGGPLTALPRDWAESTFGSGVTSAVLLYDGPGGHAHEAIADYDVSDLHVQDLGGPGVGSSTLNRIGVLTVSGCLLSFAVGLVVALSLSVQKMRGHDFATMSALGASRSALRWGTAIESAVVTASGAAMGMVLGSAWGLGLAVSADHVPWRLAWQGISFDVKRAPWGTVTGLALAAIALAAIVSVIARARLEHLTPAEQLRQAIKESAS